MKRAALILLLTLTGCVSIVRPPESPEDPTRVYLITSGRHKGLILPESDGYVEYGYGEWGWFALNNDAWYDVFDTVLWPTQGTLGRRRVKHLASAYRGVETEPIVVDAAKVAALLVELDRQFEAGKETRIYNELHDMHFVEHEKGFWAFYNCHDAVADWLRSLGCTVSRVLMRLGLSVARPKPDP